jgi:AraC-like DNA-binding protein
MHTHDFHEITIVFSGKGTYLTSNGACEIQARDVINIKPGQPHGYQNIQGLTLMHILVHPVFFEGGIQTRLCRMPEFRTLLGRENPQEQAKTPILKFRLDTRRFTEIWTIMESAARELHDRVPGYEIRSFAQFLEFLVLLLRYYGFSNDPPYDYGSNSQEKTAVPAGFRLVEFVKINFREDIALADLAKFSRLSERQIQRYFKRYTGTSVLTYVNSLRVTAACMDLTTTAKSVTAIAFDAGFNDSNYFSRCFKNFTGLSPQDYRKRYNGAAWPAWNDLSLPRE